MPSSGSSPTAMQLVQKRKDVDLTRRQEGNVLLVQYKDGDAVFYRTDSGYEESTERERLKKVTLKVISGDRETFYSRRADGTLESRTLYRGLGNILGDFRS